HQAMSESVDFHRWLQRLRAGDEQAAAVLLRRYGPDIRRLLRRRLAGSGLRHLIDPEGVCQAVIVVFFLPATSNRFVLETPDQLARLLAVMAGNKLRDEIRKQRAVLRRVGPCPEGAGQLTAVADPARDPSLVIADRDLLEALRRHLTPAEYSLVERRSSGRGWGELAQEFPTTPGGLRKRFARIQGRAARRFVAQTAWLHALPAARHA